MSEKQHRHEHSHEAGESHKELEDKKRELLNEAKREAEASKHEHQEQLDEIRKEVEEHARESERPEPATSETEPQEALTYWNSKEYRDLAYSQMLGKVRSRLSKSEKVASKVFHQPVVEKASEIGSKTIARPSGVLVGSICSFIVSMATYIFARQNSYDMSYSIFFASFVGGFLLGIALEFGYRTLRAVGSRS